MKIVTLNIAEIKPYVNNPRKNDKAVAVVAKSIEQYGFQQPIVVDKNSVIVAGHTRYRAARQLGLKEVPVVVADNLSQEQINAYRIMDNRSNENAHWDDSLLYTELKTLLEDSNIQDLSIQTGFTESELNKLFQEPIDLLEKYNAPSFIEYMSIDTEGSEYEILSVFNFDKYKFGLIHVEHNYEEPKRQLIKELLLKNGYTYIGEHKHDDFYSNQ